MTVSGLLPAGRRKRSHLPLQYHSHLPPPSKASVSDLKAAVGLGWHPARAAASSGVCLGPAPGRRTSSSCYPLVCAVSPPSLFSFWSLGERETSFCGTRASRLTLPSADPHSYLSTGEAGVLGVVGSMGIPRRPWVRAWASSSVSRRVDGLLPARDLGLGRRQRPGEVGKGTNCKC